MTSPAETSPAKLLSAYSRRWPFCVLLVAGVVLAIASPDARRSMGAAGDDGSAQASTAADSPVYSTGKSGSRLKWLPTATKPTAPDSSIKRVQFAEPTRAVRQSDIPDPPAAPSVSDGEGTWQKTAAPAELPNEPAPVRSQTKRARPLSSSRSTTAPPPSPSYSPESTFSLEGSDKGHGFALKESCPSPKDLKHINELSTNIEPPPPPPNWAESGGGVPHDCPLGNDPFQPRSFAPITFSWTASALCHKPLYFEDVQLERYGHMCGPWLQPFASAGQFFVTIPFLPYKMGVELPNECVYTLGYYRPGNCAPYMLDPIPLSVRGAFFEGAAIVGVGYAFP
ncbi:MAG: hypothetical protein ABFC96_03795 [Thermoguttaceae bacterium]